jgi:hypothetical protein
LVTACATGERPTLVDQPVGSEDAAARPVIERLEAAGDTVFTATYEITPTSTASTSQPTTATVIVSGPRQRVTVGGIDYVTDGTTARTCRDGTCTDGFDEALISDLQITHDFWGATAATRLGVEAGRSLTAAAQRQENIAGQPAACADVTVPSATPDASGSGTIIYCALDAGPLGRYVGADSTIVLTSFAPTVDDTQLTIPG